MRTIWQGPAAQAAAKYGELAPSATACCNACRACVQANLMTACLAGLAAVWAFIARRGSRSAAST